MKTLQFSFPTVKTCGTNLSTFCQKPIVMENKTMKCSYFEEALKNCDICHCLKSCKSPLQLPIQKIYGRQEIKCADSRTLITILLYFLVQWPQSLEPTLNCTFHFSPKPFDLRTRKTASLHCMHCGGKSDFCLAFSFSNFFFLLIVACY